MEHGRHPKRGEKYYGHRIEPRPFQVGDKVLCWACSVQVDLPARWKSVTTSTQFFMCANILEKLEPGSIEQFKSIDGVAVSETEQNKLKGEGVSVTQRPPQSHKLYVTPISSNTLTHQLAGFNPTTSRIPVTITARLSCPTTWKEG